jgi:3-oxoacyl-[acyl-carrier-protein] synthase II
VFLVGGSYHAERPETLLPYEFANLLARRPGPVWSAGGMALGSVGAFLVLETVAHARARGARPVARLDGIESTRGPRAPGAATARAQAQQARLGAADAVISGASGAPAATGEEASFLRGLGRPVRGSATAWGHSVEPSFVANLALAALCVHHGALPAPFGPDDAEAPMPDAPGRVMVTAWGHWRGEGMAMVSRAAEEG